MQESHESPEAQERLEAWLDRYTVAPKADLERLLSNLPPQELHRGLAPWVKGWAASYPLKPYSIFGGCAGGAACSLRFSSQFSATHGERRQLGSLGAVAVYYP